MDHGMFPSNKRSNEDVSSGSNDNKRNRNLSSTRTEYRFLIAASDAIAIFGRNGENFQSLRNQYHNLIDISQIQTPERVLILYGDEDKAMSILADILPTMAQNQSVRPGFVELRAMIHSSQAGAVIGKSGDRIKEFRQKYNLDTKVFPNSTPGDTTERILSLRGELPNIVECLKEVYSILDQTPIRGQIRNYDPSFYNGVDVERYGGFTENHDFQATRTRFNPTNQQQYTGNYNNNNNRSSSSSSSHMNYSQNNNPMPTTTQVTIPHSLSACIIGPRGTRIAQIRQQSGCVIKIDDPLPSNDRIISIIGMPNNIIQAQYLMQTAVKQSQQWTNSTVTS
ncbi:unnamed protein product [Rotaria sordida]|uniref:K Homology domain-containing protein n=1 Tax=Rotaria sordida TaxID=392033 RepID=A0A815G082_9BILA|nr:unnamed protein product [Rotaria sordida]CAF1332134.1 unnamed protein product [Rotaria sordida]CAF3772074.1 unnamed protein product [Rotaria sordida]CAF3915777.1 unnamed protein product [Rotaria sordida]